MRNIIIFSLALAFGVGVCFGWSEPIHLLGDSVDIMEATSSHSASGGFPFKGIIGGEPGLYIAFFSDSSVDSIVMIDSGDSIYDISYEGFWGAWHEAAGLVAYKKLDTAKVLHYSIPKDSLSTEPFFWEVLSVDDAYGANFLGLYENRLYWLNNDSLYITYPMCWIYDTMLVLDTVLSVDIPDDIHSINIVLREHTYPECVFIIWESVNDIDTSVTVIAMESDGTINDTLFPNVFSSSIGSFFGGFSLFFCNNEFPYHVSNIPLYAGYPYSGSRFLSTHDSDSTRKFCPTRTDGFYLDRSKSVSIYDYVAYYDEFGNVLIADGWYDEPPETIAAYACPSEIYTTSFAWDYINHFWILWTDSVGNLWGSTATIGTGGIEEISTLPANVSLTAFPNPFNSSCAIAVDVGDERARPATIEIFDLRGRLVNKPSGAFGATSLIKGGKDETPVPVPLNKGDVAQRQGVYVWHPDETIASGLYLVKARTEDGRTVEKKIIYLQ